MRCVGIGRQRQIHLPNHGRDLVVRHHADEAHVFRDTAVQRRPFEIGSERTVADDEHFDLGMRVSELGR